jgi:tRNA(Ile)-lysidine synthase
MALLVDRVRSHLVRARLFAKPGGAIVAVSGGADSVALLDLMHEVAAELGLRLMVAHADHGIQPVSRSVGRAVGALAEGYGLPFELGELDLGPAASETLARRARYRWLRDVQRRHDARYLVTAHHQDDQVETVLLRALHGSGLAGLAGIPVRGRGGLVRPLLPFAKSELAAHAAARGLPVHDDPANCDPRHARSWVRTVLLPLLNERFGAGVAGDVLRLGRHAAWERRAWDRALELVPDLSLRVDAAGFDVARGALARYDATLAAALLGAAARRAGLVLGPTRAQRLAAFAGKASGRRLQLPGGWVAETAFERVRVFRDVAPPPTPQSVIGSGEHGRAVFGEFVVSWEAAPAPNALERAGWTTWIGPAGWELRSYHAGDRLVPLGGVGHRPVRRLLMEAQVPRGERGHYPVIARGETILWVPGICRSAADLPSPGTPAVRLDVTECREPEANRRA